MVNPDTRTVLFEDRRILPAVDTHAELPAQARPGQTCLVEDEDRFYRRTESGWQIVNENPEFGGTLLTG